jgi:hypothetical protein
MPKEAGVPIIPRMHSCAFGLMAGKRIGFGNPAAEHEPAAALRISGNILAAG